MHSLAEPSVPGRREQPPFAPQLLRQRRHRSAPHQPRRRQEAVVRRTGRQRRATADVDRNIRLRLVERDLPDDLRGGVGQRLTAVRRAPPPGAGCGSRTAARGGCSSSPITPRAAVVGEHPVGVAAHPVEHAVVVGVLELRRGRRRYAPAPSSRSLNGMRYAQQLRSNCQRARKGAPRPRSGGSGRGRQTLLAAVRSGPGREEVRRRARAGRCGRDQRSRRQGTTACWPRRCGVVGWPRAECAPARRLRGRRRADVLRPFQTFARRREQGSAGCPPRRGSAGSLRRSLPARSTHASSCPRRRARRRRTRAEAFRARA